MALMFCGKMQRLQRFNPNGTADPTHQKTRRAYGALSFNTQIRLPAKIKVICLF